MIAIQSYAAIINGRVVGKVVLAPRGKYNEYKLIDDDEIEKYRNELKTKECCDKIIFSYIKI